jgi:gliding motility-associated-like protein
VSDKGCSSFATKTTQVYNQPNASFSAVNTCLGTPVVFSNTTTINSENISFYVWSFGDGEQKVNNGNITYSYNSPLTYNVTLVAVSENFCKDTVTGSVTVFPSANLSVAVSDTIIIDGSSVTINALSTNAVSYLWSNNASSATINVNTAGTYSVTATTVDNCMATGSVKINAMKLPPPDVAANVLTPNGDGINDYFTISRLDLYGTCSVMIYNMWNDLVYSSTEYANDWDGTANGKIIDSGAYFYIISCTEQETFKGTLNILR